MGGEKTFLTPKQILIFNVLIICGAGVYVIFVKTITEVFIFCIIGGSQIGSISAFSRSILSKMLPREKQSRYFSFYDFTQKGSAWIGPLIVGALTDALGDSHYLTIVVVVSLVEAAIGIPFLLYVSPSRGEAARAVIDAADDVRVQRVQNGTQQSPPRQLEEDKDKVSGAVESFNGSPRQTF